jgi:sulfoxide reductase heme-binding subunit YedZ
MSAPDVVAHGWWLASRSAGIVAMLLVTLSVLLGLTLGGRLTRRPGMARVVKTLHEQTALSGLVAIAVHGLTLLGDPWLRPGLAGVLVPFTMGYRPLFTGLGVVAGELAAILGLSFYARRWISPRRWRLAHRLTPLVYALSVVHVLGSGTDASSAWLRVPLLGSATVVAVLLVARIVSGRRRRSARPAPNARAVMTATAAGDAPPAR